MIRTMAVTKDRKVLGSLSLEQLTGDEVSWYWVDFSAPDEQEASLLESFFHFHHLAIEDCFHYLQRPKLDYYEGFNFFVLHRLQEKNLVAEEVDVFLTDHSIVTFHKGQAPEMDKVWERIASAKEMSPKGPFFVFYQIMDKLVDQYFPILYQIEDGLNEVGNMGTLAPAVMDRVFALRSDLLRLRKTIIPMRELVYRIINSEHLTKVKQYHEYFLDVYDHLVRLSEMVESNREMTADIRDNYISLNSNRMNAIMMVLTVITVIFMPLTFIVGVYGMNFDYMPELKWHYGYFAVLILMAFIAFGMYLWFKRKGWFDVHK
jgi:magnesium transporter